MMDEDKTKDQLIDEMVKLRRRITELEGSQTLHQQPETTLTRSA